MTVQDISPRVGWSEGGKVGQPGIKSLPFKGKVSGHGYTYEEGGRKYGQIKSNFTRPPTGYTCTRQ